MESPLLAASNPSSRSEVPELATNRPAVFILDSDTKTLTATATVRPGTWGESGQFLSPTATTNRPSATPKPIGPIRAKDGIVIRKQLRNAIASRCLLATLVFTTAGFAADDSTSILFQDAVVRSYSLDFYGDSAWSSKLETMWKADSGYLPARFFDGQTTLDSVGVRYKGNSSFTLAGNNPKKPFKIKFNEFKTQTYYGEKVLNFSNGIGDPTLLREKISYDISAKYLPTPRSNFVTLSADGKSIGLYTQVEQADKTFLKRWYEKAGANLFKAGDDGAPLKWISDSARSYANSGLYELKTNETADDWTGLSKFVAALDHGSDSGFCREHRRWIDPDNVAKYLAFDMVFSNFDSYTGSGRNFYLYQVSDSGAMHVLPWDMNLSFGAYTNGWNVVAQDLVSLSNVAEHPLVRQVLACDSLRWRYLHWVGRMVAGEASTDSVKARIDRLVPVIRAAVAADSNKFYSTAAFETNLVSNLKPTPSTSIPGLVAFSQARNANLAAQLATYLPAGYDPTPIRQKSSKSGIAVNRTSSGWIATGLSSQGATRIEWLSLDGRVAGSKSVPAGIDNFRLDPPRGVSLVRIRSSTTSHTFSIANF